MKESSAQRVATIGQSPGPMVPPQPSPNTMQPFPGLVWVTDDQLNIASPGCFRDPQHEDHPEVVVGTHVSALLSPCPDAWVEQHLRAHGGQRATVRFGYRGGRYLGVLSPRDAESVGGVYGYALPLPAEIDNGLAPLSRVAGRLAHDLNNTATVILSYTQFILDDLDKSSPLHEDASVVLEAVKRISTLVAQLLSFSGRVTPHLHSVDLCALVDECCDSFAAPSEPTYELVRELAGESLHIRADPLLLGRVIAALLTNAVEAMNQGGQIHIQVARAHDAHPEAVKLVVSDQGTGLSHEARAHLFEPFFTTKTKSGGATRGLGLASAYGIVRQCGGQIALVPSMQGGTRCELLFPLIGQRA